MTGSLCSPPVISGLSLLVCLMLIAVGAHPKGKRGSPYFTSLLIMLSAVGAGVVAGSFASPSETSEEAMFKVLAGLLAAFGTGFLMKHYRAQIRIFPSWLAEELNAVRFWLFVAALLGASIHTYVYRSYILRSQAQHDVLRELSKDLSNMQRRVDQLFHASSAASVSNAPAPAASASSGP